MLILSANQLTDLKEQQVNKAKETVLKVAKLVDDRLKLNSFLTTDSLTIADISAHFTLSEVLPQLDKETKNLGNLKRWSKHIASLPI